GTAQSAVLAQISALLAANQITGTQVTTAATNMIGSGLTAAQALNVLIAIAVQSNGATENAAIAEIVALLTSHQVTVSQVMSAVSSAHAADQTSANLLLGLAEQGDVALALAIGTEMVALFYHPFVSYLDDAIAAVDSARSSQALSVD